MHPSIVSVAHTGITVPDLDAALDFWHGALGFVVARRFELDRHFAPEVVGVPDADIRAAVVEGAGHTIELLQYRRPADRETYRPRSCDVGSVHIALTVTSIDAVIELSAPHGWNAVGTPQTMRAGPRAGTIFIYLRDESGITLELVEPPT